MASNKQVIVLNDAISSRSIYDFSTAIAEMRDIGVRILVLKLFFLSCCATPKPRSLRKSAN